MEQRAYRPYKNGSSEQMSRIERDLSTSPYNLTTFLNGTNIDMIRRVLPEGRRPHICIVGAGVSGLRCAAILAEKGIKVTILEGRNRVGGRVHQIDYLGYPVDLGPNWIHGADNNPIVDLANKSNTLLFAPGLEKVSVYDESGQRLNESRASEISEIVWGIIGDAFNHSNNDSVSIPPDMSLMDYFRVRVQELELDRPTSKLVFQMAHIWGDYVGEPIETQSLKYCWLEECLDEKNLFVAGTYKAILDQIVQAGLSHADLQLSTKVVSIHSDHATNGNPSITIKTANNKILNFDDVVMTAPLGWLKRNPSIFVPLLPVRLRIAIKNMSYGRLEKVYVTFPVPFWISPPDPEADSSSSPSWPPFFTQFLSPNYDPEHNPHRWTLEPVSLASLPSSTAHPTLLFYLNGPCSQYVTSLISPLDPTSPEYHSILSRFFYPYYSRLPNFNSASENCQPTKIFSTNWQNDELAGCGSYTNFQVSSSKTTSKPQQPRENAKDYVNNPKDMPDGDDDDSAEVELDHDIEALREGCPDRGLWFAGEHTAPFIALGTVTGAYWSGEAVARRIAAAYGFGHETKHDEEVMASKAEALLGEEHDGLNGAV